MITFVDLIFSPMGQHAGQVVRRLQELAGVHPVMGDHDVMFRWKTAAEFDRTMQAIHDALGGTGATYRVFTVEDSYLTRDMVPWIQPLGEDPSEHPGFPEGHSPH